MSISRPIGASAARYSLGSAGIHKVSAQNSAQNPFLKGIDHTAFTETLLPGILNQIPVLLWHGQSDAREPQLTVYPPSANEIILSHLVLFTDGDAVTIQNVQGPARTPSR